MGMKAVVRVVLIFIVSDNLRLKPGMQTRLARPHVSRWMMYSMVNIVYRARYRCSDIICTRTTYTPIPQVNTTHPPAQNDVV